MKIYLVVIVAVLLIVIPDISVSGSSRVKRSAIFSIWPEAIVPYTIEEPFSSKGKQLFNQAIDKIQSKTCIKFIPKKPRDAYWLKVVQDDNVCGSSSVGRQRRENGQDITFGKGCMNLQTFENILGHALGFPHEQDRPDRDDYIIWDNTLSTCPTGTPNHGSDKVKGLDQAAVDIFYDYVSLMHDWKECIRPILSGPIKIGAGDAGKNTFSVLDIEKLNAMYDCKGCKSYRFRKINQLAYYHKAVPAGYDLDKQTLYICRVYHEGNIFPGKSKPDSEQCWVSVNGTEYAYKKDFEVLTNPEGANLVWQKRPSNFTIPENAIKGGRTAERETVYIGRCSFNSFNHEIIVPGRLMAGDRELRVPFKGGEYRCSDYEILVCE